MIFSSSEKILKDTFRDAQLIQIESFINSILETEDFSEFSKYTKYSVTMHFKGFLYRLTSLIWMNYADYESNIEEFFRPMTNAMAKQIATIKLELKNKKLLTDVMSDKQLDDCVGRFFLGV